MPFELRYEITRNLIPLSSRRPGTLMAPGVRFLVAHDSGNPGATAADHVRFYMNQPNPPAASVSSAQLFVDDQSIMEVIPAVSAPEQARHVRYSVPMDNHLYGFDANRAAIGIELCYGNSIDPTKAYDRYVWLLAYLCALYELDPARDVVGHQILDPNRRSDPGSALELSGRSYRGLLADVVTSYEACKDAAAISPNHRVVAGNAQTTVSLRRRGAASLGAPGLGVLAPGAGVLVKSIVAGDAVSGNSDWAELADGGFCWTGGLTQASDLLAPVQPPAPAAAQPVGQPATGSFTERARLTAIAQWEFFGENSQDGQGLTTKKGHHEADYAPEGSTEQSWYARVGDYWKIVHRPDLDGRDTGWPWSAAFISFVMNQAGAGTRFDYAAQHAYYISRAITALQNDNQAAGYWCYRLGDERPAVGDIVCWSRQPGIDYDHQNHGSYLGHSDLIVAVADDQVEIIGGNVDNSVTRRPLTLDPNGKIAALTRANETLFGLMKCRIL